MRDTLSRVYGQLLVVRSPVPATVNKAGANYKSEVTHLTYSPRSAYDEWLAICEGILGFGGDALFLFEARDDALLDVPGLVLDGDGCLRAEGSNQRLISIDEVETGRVFAANGPWVTVEDNLLRGLMPKMLPHRAGEGAYYRQLLARLADHTGRELELVENPHRWEGMADIAAVGDRVVLTYTVAGHYDRGLEPKTMRSSLEGVTFAADFAGIPEEKRIFAELVYPHFHGDTVHFGARPSSGEPVLIHYPGGLFDGSAHTVAAALGHGRIVPIGRGDAVEAYAGNSRQVGRGVLVPDGVSETFLMSLNALGLQTCRVPLFELFGKAGGGPACATLYMPTDLGLPEKSELRFSQQREVAYARRSRIAERLTVMPEFFEGKARG